MKTTKVCSCCNGEGKIKVNDPNVIGIPLSYDRPQYTIKFIPAGYTDGVEKITKIDSEQMARDFYRFMQSNIPWPFAEELARCYKNGGG
jgi:hypothetical protein